MLHPLSLQRICLRSLRSRLPPYRKIQKTQPQSTEILRDASLVFPSTFLGFHGILATISQQTHPLHKPGPGLSNRNL